MTKVPNLIRLNDRYYRLEQGSFSLALRTAIQIFIKKFKSFLVIVIVIVGFVGSCVTPK
jgi:hypothetical protein